MCFQARIVNLSDCDIADAPFAEFLCSARPFLEEPLALQPETNLLDLFSLLIAFDAITFHLNFDCITSCLDA